MEMAFALLGGLGAGGGTAAAGAATAAGTAAGTATAATGLGAVGSTLTTILQGGATLLGMMATIEAGDQEADMYEAKAIDAQAEKPLETLQGIQRRTGLKQELIETLGEQETAFAASGVDLSFGTPAEARSDALHEADRALTGENATEETRLNRLDERTSQYRLTAKRARKSARRTALAQGLSFGVGAFSRG
jgi:hypothetical protein